MQAIVLVLGFRPEKVERVIQQLLDRSHLGIFNDIPSQNRVYFIQEYRLHPILSFPKIRYTIKQDN
jgi:hypothetical protein